VVGIGAPLPVLRRVRTIVSIAFGKDSQAQSGWKTEASLVECLVAIFLFQVGEIFAIIRRVDVV
jgi:hypothetical protein